MTRDSADARRVWACRSCVLRATILCSFSLRSPTWSVSKVSKRTVFLALVLSNSAQEARSCLKSHNWQQISVSYFSSCEISSTSDSSFSKACAFRDCSWFLKLVTSTFENLFCPGDCKGTVLSFSLKCFSRLLMLLPRCFCHDLSSLLSAQFLWGVFGVHRVHWIAHLH